MSIEATLSLNSQYLIQTDKLQSRITVCVHFEGRDSAFSVDFRSESVSAGSAANSQYHAYTTVNAKSLSRGLRALADYIDMVLKEAKAA